MKIDSTFLRSKVARRIFLLFIACALLPIAALSVLSFTHVTSALHAQSQRRLHQASKAMALAIYERLLFLEAEIETVAFYITSEGKPLPGAFSRGFGESLGRFRGLALVSERKGPTVLFGRFDETPLLRFETHSHIRAGKTLLVVQHRPGLPARLFMTRAVDPKKPERAMLVGEISSHYLWGTGDRYTLPPFTELCVLDETAQPLVCSFREPVSFPEPVLAAIARSASGQFEWKQEGKEYVAGFWSVPLKFRFSVPQWTVILSESKDAVLAPIAHFKKTFPSVALIALGVVLLLSIAQIRRHLVPLEKLREGTSRISMRDFRSRVTVDSGDEFEELAASFNAMASELGKQFNALETMAEIDRAILATLDTDKILDTVLSRIRDLFPCDRVSMTLLGSNGKGIARTYMRDGSAQDGIAVKEDRISPEEVRRALNFPEPVLTLGKQIPPPLAPLLGEDMDSWLVLPIVVAEELSGIIALGYLEPPRHSRDDLTHARRLADQVAVAIHNSKLYEATKKQALELERSNRVKDEFLSVISHELKTPLNVVLGYTSMVKEGILGEVNPEQRKALEKVLDGANDQLALINSILYTTAIDSEAVRVESREVKLAELLAGLKTYYQVPLHKEVTINWDYPADLPVISTDEAKLRHILQNLINNAIKFTQKGALTVSARHLPEQQAIEFKVRDTGIGIPPEKIPLIFEKFYQVDSSNRRQYGGTGLGLYIVKKFTRLLGGTIDVESEMGVGSTFTLTLPLRN